MITKSDIETFQEFMRDWCHKTGTCYVTQLIPMSAVDEYESNMQEDKLELPTMDYPLRLCDIPEDLVHVVSYLSLESALCEALSTLRKAIPYGAALHKIIEKSQASLDTGAWDNHLTTVEETREIVRQGFTVIDGGLEEQ